MIVASPDISLVFCLILLFVHFLFDFGLQSRVQATRKSNNYEYLLKHIAIQCVGYIIIAMLAGFSLFFTALFVAINGLAHGIQDRFIWRAYKWKVRKGIGDEDIVSFIKYNRFAEDYWFYTTIAIDQLLHLALLFASFAYLSNRVI